MPRPLRTPQEWRFIMPARPPIYLRTCHQGQHFCFSGWRCLPGRPGRRGGNALPLAPPVAERTPPVRTAGASARAAGCPAPRRDEDARRRRRVHLWPWSDSDAAAAGESRQNSMLSPEMPVMPGLFTRPTGLAGRLCAQGVTLSVRLTRRRGGRPGRRRCAPPRGRPTARGCRT